MYPPIFATCFADATVKARLGSNPCRLYPFGEAPQDVGKPYAAWQTVSGEPENYLGQAPDTDGWSIQVDVYAESVDDAREAAEALRDAIEPVAHITFWGGESRDPDTNDYRYTFSVDWWVKR